MGLFLIITPNTHGKVSEAVAKEKSAHGDVLCVVHERAPIAAASDHLDVKKNFFMAGNHYYYLLHQELHY